MESHMELKMRRFFRAPWRSMAVTGVVALMALQLVPYGRDHTNPPTRQEPAWDSPATRALARRACFDCHSHETEWPIYAHIAPASWLIERNVAEGRKALNFSDWRGDTHASREVVEEVTEGEMPPVAYRLMHGHARLSSAEQARLANGFRLTLSRSR